MKDKKQPIAIIAVTGGIAAYKAATVCSMLKKENFDVHVLMTPSATEFIAPLTFEAITGNNVQTSIFPQKNNASKKDLFPHLYPASISDIFAVVPATADIIAKITLGFGDDIVCASALALNKNTKRIFCPAMNVNMWNKTTVQNNSKKLTDDGWLQLGPIEGLQACGDYGLGKMTEPHDIVNSILNKKKKSH